MNALQPERWQQIKSIFDEALEIPSDGRPEWLQSATASDPLLHAQVAELLAHYEADEEFLDTPSAESGLRFGVYRTIRVLGRGGMGTVYLGQRNDGQFERQVAIKEMAWLPTMGLGQEGFLAERKLLALLDHPNITRLYDAGVSEAGAPYFVMEYVDGETLNEYCQRLKPDRQARLEIFRQLCSAVEAAHARSIFHGDLKPANVMVTASGQLKLLDFGVATYLPFAPAPVATPLTAAYSSPERLRGGLVDAGGDIYSLGVILYELVSGEHPYRRPDESVESLKERLERLELLPPLGDRDLDFVIALASAKDPSARYASLSELRRDVERLCAGQTLRPSALPWVLAAAVFLIGLTVVFAWQWKQSQQRQALSAQISSAALLKLEIQDLPKRSKDRQAMRQEALQALQNAVASASNDQALLRQVASGFRRLGDLAVDYPALDMGSAQDAVSYFNKARPLLERAPTDAAVRRDLAALKASLGSSLALLGQSAEAGNALEQAVVELEALPASVTNRDRELARALQRLARLNFEQAMPGRPLLERSLSLHRALSIGAAVADQLAWIRCLEELSWAEMQAGDGLDKAQAYAIQAVEAARALRLRYPDRVVLDVSLADALGQLAQVLASMNLPKDAMKAAAESSSIILSLHQQDPANAPLASYLAGRHFVLGDMQHAAGAFVSAQASYEKSYQVAFQLSQTEPANSQYAIDAALAKAYVGQETMERKRYAEARMEIGIALRLFESRPEAAKGEVGWLSSYGIALGQLARSFARAGDPAAAGGIYEKLLANQELVLAKAPSRPALRLAAALKYAEAAQNHREWARGVDSKKARAALLSEAKQWKQQALDMLLDLEAKQQLDPRWLPYLQAARKDQLMLQ